MTPSQLSRRCWMLGVGAGIGATRVPSLRAAETLMRRLGEAEIDWHRGFIQARGGAAADIRLPGPQAARPAAERNARARATAILRAALPLFDLGGGKTVTGKALDGVLRDLHTLRIEYESNGGVLVILGVAFSTLAGRPSIPGKEDDDHGGVSAEKPPLIIAVPRVSLAFRPTLVLEGRPVTPAFATYRIGVAPPSSLSAKRDRTGRFVVEGKAPLGLGGRSVILHASAVD